jgi:hypothetical protein
VSSNPSDMPSSGPSVSSHPSVSYIPSTSSPPSVFPSSTPSRSVFPSSLPSISPTSSPTYIPLVEPEELNPETGDLGEWLDGGVDARLFEDADMASQGLYSFEIQDNSGSKSSMELPLLNLEDITPACTGIVLTFDYITLKFDPDDAFVAEYAVYDAAGSSPKLDKCAWKRIKTWVYDKSDDWLTEQEEDLLRCAPIIDVGTVAKIRGNQGKPFVKETIEFPVFPETGKAYSFRLRADATTNSDAVYFDNVKVGCKTTLNS